MQRCLIVIPARGGSKGIRNKNLKSVGGVSLIERSVSVAIRSGVGDVCVSTDSDIIGARSSALGATVVKRPAEISGDLASSESAVIHALDTIDPLGNCYSLVCLMQATSPFLTSGRLKDGVNLILSSEEIDAVISVYKSVDHEYRWSANAGGSIVPLQHWQDRAPRQLLPPVIMENGAFYICRRDKFVASMSRFGGDDAVIYPVEMSEYESTQIDNELDLLWANFLLSNGIKV